MHHDTYVKYISDEIGYGVFAAIDFPEGTIIWSLDEKDMIFSKDEFERLPQKLREHISNFSYEVDECIVFNWCISKYMNHCCNPNTRRVDETETKYITIKDIAKDEQITYDYSIYPEIKWRCFCGSANCRGAINK